MKKTIILYHSDCTDGFSGAWAAWKKFGSRANYIPIKHQVPPPDGLTGKTIYLIDIVYPPEVMQTLTQENRVVVIDHHKTAKESVAVAHDALYDLSHSGAVLAWHYFHAGKRVPRLLLYVEEGDLWNFKLPGTREILASTEPFPKNFRMWSKLEKEIGTAVGRARHRAHGKVIRAYQESQIQDIARTAEKGTFHGHRVMVVNTPVLDSEVAHALLSKEFPVAIVWRRVSGLLRVSLRSLPSVDVSALATLHGGGGHPRAAGFRMPVTEKFPWHYSS